MDPYLIGQMFSNETGSIWGEAPLDRSDEIPRLRLLSECLSESEQKVYEYVAVQRMSHTTAATYIGCSRQWVDTLWAQLISRLKWLSHCNPPEGLKEFIESLPDPTRDIVMSFCEAPLKSEVSRRLGIDPVRVGAHIKKTRLHPETPVDIMLFMDYLESAPKGINLKPLLPWAN